MCDSQIALEAIEDQCRVAQPLCSSQHLTQRPCLPPDLHPSWSMVYTAGPQTSRTPPSPSRRHSSVATLFTPLNVYFNQVPRPLAHCRWIDTLSHSTIANNRTTPPGLPLDAAAIASQRFGSALPHEAITDLHSSTSWPPITLMSHAAQCRRRRAVLLHCSLAE